MYRQTIALPGSRDFDITPILPIINSPPFQRLHHIRQLGINYLIFPGAQHSRYEHSLGTYLLTKERTDKWLEEENIISPDQAINLNLYGLLHDIGHAPYSHDVENLCQGSHHDHGLTIIRQLSREITACGGDPELIKLFIQHQHPLACCVNHQWLGTDKIDYLLRDSRHTSESIGFRTGDLLNHVMFRNQALAIDSRFISEVMTFLTSYMTMYDRVYLRKACLGATHFLRKLVSTAMKYGRALTPRTLPIMIDSQLEMALLNSTAPNVSHLSQGLLFQRRWPKVAVMLVPAGTTVCDRLSNKNIAIYEIPLDQILKFNQFQKLDSTNRLEKSIADLAHLNPMKVLVIPNVDSHRFVPRDIPVYNGDAYIDTLLNLRPKFKASLEEIAHARICVRVCVMPEHRQAISSPQTAPRVRDLLLEAIK